CQSYDSSLKAYIF
nr:immunoglobulin light chain junction region [Macaca mulatta]